VAQFLFVVRRFGGLGVRIVLLCPFNLCLGLSYRKLCVVLGVAFVMGTMLCNLLNNLFGVVAARERAFGESPVVFGLT
jgi:hypothetical protein